MSKIFCSLILILVITASAYADYLAPLKKGTTVQLKEVTVGYKITIIAGVGTHKVVACEPDFVTLTDLTEITTIRINKNAVLSITEIKVPKN